jgi:hypothetical protein
VPTAAGPPLVMSGVPPPMVAASGASGVACLERVCGRIAPDAPVCGYEQSAVPDVISGRPAPVRVGARPYQRIGIVESNRQIHGPFSARRLLSDRATASIHSCLTND